MTLISQNLKELKWTKRSIVIYAPTFDNLQAQEQVSLLKAHASKFDDYKLCVIEHTNEGERTNFGEIQSVNITEQLKGFKVFLVGLDGGVKFESSVVKPAQIFFDLINTMPMRRNELRDN